LDPEALGNVVNAAKELRDFDEEQKHKDRQSGNRSEIDDLPPGHPLRLMQEQAKARLENREEFENEQEKFRVAKKAKKVQKKQAKTQAANDDHRRRVRVANEFNKDIDRVSAEISELGGKIKNVVKEFDGFATPRVKLVRLNRLLSAVHKGLSDSKLNIGQPEIG